MAVQAPATTARVSITSALASTNSGFTLAGWFRNDVDLNNNATYARLWNDATTTVLTFATQPDGVTPSIFTGGGNVVSPVAPAVGEWWYLAVTVSAGSATLYAIAPNGTVSSASGAVSTGTANGLTLFGRHATVPEEWFQGSSAYVRVWQDDLSLAELQQERTHPTAVRSAQLWADWELEEWDAVNDASGNSRHLVAGTTALNDVTGPVIAVYGALDLTVPVPTADYAGRAVAAGGLAGAVPVPVADWVGRAVARGVLTLTVPVPDLQFADRPALRIRVPLPYATTGGLGLLSAVEQELLIQRHNTRAFIEADPVDVALTPVVENVLPSGGVATTPGAARPVQRFRLIPMSHTERPQRSGIVSGAASGQTRRHDFTLLGEWDAVVFKNDRWSDAEGRLHVVDALVPFNGYQQKALVTLFRGPSS